MANDENQDPQQQGPRARITSEEKKPTKIKKKRSQYYRNKKKKKNDSEVGPKKGTFKGTISEMNGHVFECHGEAHSASQYTRTMEELESYAIITYKYGDDVAYLVRHLEEFDVTTLLPAYPTKTIKTKDADGKDVQVLDPTLLKVWDKETDHYVMRKALYTNNKKSLYMVIWAQCSDAMKAKLKSLDEYPNIDKNRDCLHLLKHIKNISYKFESQGRYVFKSLLDAKAHFYRFQQTQSMTNAVYFQRFQDIYNIIHHYGGSLGDDPVLVRDELRRANISNYESLAVGNTDYDDHVAPARSRFLAIAFLKGADPQRFGKLLQDLENQFSRGNNQYPKDITSAYNLLVNYKGGNVHRDRDNSNGGRDKKNKKQIEESDSDESEDAKEEKSGVTFLTDAKGDKIICFNCGGNHYANSPACPANKSKAGDKQYLFFNATTVDALVFITSTFNSRNYDDSVYVNLLEDIGIPSSAFAHVHTTYTFTQGPSLHIDWILLDNQSNIDVFCNARYLLDIGPAPYHIRSHSNGGSQITTEQGTLPGYGTVWYNADSIANILSFSNVEDKFKITYRKGMFRVHLSASKKLDFIRVENNLFIYKPNGQCTNEDIFIFLQTVDGNKSHFTPDEIEKADLARRLYICLGRPSHRTFKYMLNHDLIKNADVTAADAERAVVLYGNDVGALRGKTVRAAPKAVKIPAFIPLPSEIKERYGTITLCVDFFFVERMPFLLSFSRNIQFLMIEQTLNRKKMTMIDHFTTVLQIYHGRGFRVRHILGDNEFDCLTEFFQRSGIHLNPTAADEHVHDIERQIRIVKERIRAHISVSPFRYIPLTMKKELILGCVTAINYTVRRSGISPYLTPMMLVMGRELDAYRLCRLPFGSYCEVSEFEEPRNDTAIPRTQPAICLRPLDNFQGGYYFLCCSTWRVIKRWDWTELPMPAEIIASVEDRAREERTLRAHSLDFTFLRRDRSVITSMLVDNSDLLVDLDPPEDPGASDGPPIPFAPAPVPIGDPPVAPPAPPMANPGANPGAPAVQPTPTPTPEPTNVPNSATTAAAMPTRDGVDDDNDDLSDDDNDDLSSGSNRSLSSDMSYDDDEEEDHNKNPPESEVNNSLAKILNDVAEILNDVEAIDESQDEEEQEENAIRRNPRAKDDITGADIDEDNIITGEVDPERPGTAHYNLRQKVPTFLEKEYTQLMQAVGTQAPENIPFINYNGRYAFAFTQMSAAEGLRRYGDKAAEALVKEWKQLHDLNVFEGVEFASLTHPQRATALRLVQLIKEKRCRKIKGRTCADGRPQREYVDSADSTSPTVAVEALLLTLVIDAHERRHVATCDISGAFLKSDIDDETFVVVDGALVEMLLRSDPSYEAFVHTTKNGKKVVYLRLLKALYGTVRAARLFWENLTDKLVKFGFKVNDYDQCVANMNIEGSQCTVCWHVDDLKISHKKKSVVEKVIKYLEDIFGEMNCVHGSMHTYVGMDIIFPGDGSVQIDMSEYTQEAIDEFPEKVTHATSPASSTLFDINEQCAKLPEATREIFHKIVAKLLFVTTRGRPDIFLPIAFLTSRVSKADTDDWRKLKRVLGYLQSTKDLRLTLSADSLNIMKWWVDASFAVRDDFKSQTGSGMTMGRGMLFSKSAKQKLVTKSSTEAELVGASDTVAQMVWTKYFLEAQGYQINNSILYQDNKSAILLEKNGKMSSSARTRHVNIRYFFIRDRISAKELSVEYCPTDQMLADFHTKPLQGAKFILFRDMILGITSISFDT